MAHNRDYKPEDILFPNQAIVESDIVQEMQAAMLDYAMSVIVDRALPDVRDGLKPVHRRILYTMYEDNLTADQPFKKSATCVGDVLGRYHPHGDASVYDAMVRLAQNFSLRYMLVDGHGNFGSVDGDPPAAYRYTEARMSKISDEMLRDINKETVDWIPNFDESRKEPRVLPSRFPNLLVNGSTGIAVGMTTGIPPHNLGEVIDACVKVLDDPEATLADLMECIKGPDFPTSGIIMGRAGIRQAYATGRGKVIVRARTEFEEYGRDNRTRIIVRELPYMVKKRALIKTIADQVKEKRLDGISDLRDETDRNGMRVVIELKRDANANVVLNKLFAQTAMQSSYGIIFRALVDDQKQPKILSLRNYIDEYLAFQKEIIRRRTQFDLKKALERAHLLEGLIIAQDNIDEVIHIIRTSYDNARERLMERFGLDEVQAQAILDMRLKALQGLDREKLENEYKELEERIAYYRSLLADEGLLVQVLKEELLAIRDKFADPRRTEIQDVSGEVDFEDLIPEQTCVFTLSNGGYIKRTPVNEYKQQNKGGKGVTGLKFREEDTTKTMFICSSHDYIMFFTTRGRCYRLKGYEIPEGSRQSKGMNVVNLLPLEAEEQVSVMIRVPEFGETDAYLCMATRCGVIKRTALDDYRNIRKSGIIAINLDEGDELAWVKLTSGSDKLLLATRKGMAIAFNEEDARVIGRTARGVRAIRLQAGDQVVGMDILREGRLVLTVSETGLGRLSPIANYRVQSRGGKGLINYHVARFGDVAAIEAVDPADNLLMISSDGIIARISIGGEKGIRICARPSKGVRIMRLTPGQTIISAVSVPAMGEETEAVEADPDSEAEAETEIDAETEAEETPVEEND
ncbi:MAG: DNA gyrase subunit A [Clostridia bacterium]|nr:DNA gyrase subunit A [Clostridia bacterium]